MSSVSTEMPRNVSCPPMGTTSYLPIDDMYRLTKGDNGEWGIEGYQVPKKCPIPSYIDPSFGKQKREFLKEIEKRAKDPDPRKYAPDPKKQFETDWLKKPYSIQGGVQKYKIHTHLDLIEKRGALIPGPGNYFKEEKSEKSKPKATAALGKFGKAEGADFLTDAQFHANETPGAGHYLNFKDHKEEAKLVRYS
jgi:hypothetical protein